MHANDSLYRVEKEHNDEDGFHPLIYVTICINRLC
nr:MAG TPA: hypothetical protein [Caudoviricetes sp.]